MENKWIFHETQKQTKFSGDKERYNLEVTFKRVDVFYCQNTCEIKEIVKEETRSLPWGKDERDVRPIWF